MDYFGENLIFLLTREGKNQAQIAESLGFSPLSEVCNFVPHKANLNSQTFLGISRCLS